MKKNLKVNATLMSIGIFTVAISQIASRYFELHDLVKGLCVGIGIGFLVLSLMFGNLKKVE